MDFWVLMETQNNSLMTQKPLGGDVCEVIKVGVAIEVFVQHVYLRIGPDRNMSECALDALDGQRCRSFIE